jgi:hypothetical protein
MEFRYKRLCRLGMNVHKQAGGAFLILSVRGGNVFKDRVDAGRRLAGKLVPYSEGEGIVLAIPRGGVVVGYEIARRLGYLMDLIIPRKIGSPHNSEVGKMRWIPYSLLVIMSLIIASGAGHRW